MLPASIISKRKFWTIVEHNLGRPGGSVGNLETFWRWGVSSNFGAVTRTEILSHIMPNKWSGERLVYVVGTQIFDSTVDEGNGRLNPSRDKKVRQSSQKKGFLLCDSGWCVHILTDRYSLKSTIIGWQQTNKNNPRNGRGNFPTCPYRGKLCCHFYFIFHDLCQQQTHTQAQACTRQPMKNRNTTIPPTCDTVAFREMSSTVSMKYFCFPTRYICYSVSFRRRTDPHSQVYPCRAASL